MVNLGSAFVKWYHVREAGGRSCLIFRVSHSQYDEICLPLLLKQAAAAGITMAFAFVATTVIARVVDRVVGLRLTAEDEETGTDLTQHGETAYSLRERPRSRGRRTADLGEDELIELQERLVVRAAERVLASIGTEVAPRRPERVGTLVPDPLD